MTHGLVLDQVVKRFGDTLAVDHPDFRVAEGEVFGFLGGDGASETTSRRMILDVIRPDEGRMEVLGGPPGRRHAREIRFLPEERGLHRSMNAIDTIVYFARPKGMTAADARARGFAVLDRFGLARNDRTPVDKLSKERGRRSGSPPPSSTSRAR